MVEEKLDALSQLLLNLLARKEKTRRSLSLIRRSNRYILEIWSLMHYKRNLYFIFLSFFKCFHLILYQVEPGNLQDAAFLNAVVKVEASLSLFIYCMLCIICFSCYYVICFFLYLSRFTAPILLLITPFLGKSKGNIQVPEGKF